MSQVERMALEESKDGTLNPPSLSSLSSSIASKVLHNDLGIDIEDYFEN